MEKINKEINNDKELDVKLEEILKEVDVLEIDSSVVFGKSTM